jgi:predicted TPR repeat methyltransferase
MTNNFDYKNLSKIYDSCKSSFWDKYCELIHPHLEVDTSYILDLGCGTGLAIDYLSCTADRYLGVDLSPDMLAIAREKHPDYNFVLTSILTIDFPQKFDFVLSAFDTVNHLLRLEDWKKLFECACLHMKIGAVFIFDVVTPYDHSVNWPGQLNVTDSEDWLYLQRSEFDEKTERGLLKTTIFQKQTSFWLRQDEAIEQISLPKNVILELLREAGLTCCETLDVATGAKDTPSTETLLFVCKKLTP